MRKSWLLPVALLTLGVVVAACTGSSGDDTSTSPTPTPSPSPSPSPGTLYDFTIGATGWPHPSAGVRVIQTNGGAGRAIVFCQTPTTGGSWTVTTAQLLSSTYAYNIEVYGDNGTTGGQYNTGDHTWYFQRGAATATNFNITFPHNTTPQKPITWTNGQGCPGG
jgi:hypothetical protein